MPRKRIYVWICLFCVTFSLSSFLILHSPRTAGQQNFPAPNRRPACSCFCGDGSFKSFNLFNSQDAKAGKCFGGPLPADACGKTGQEMPAEQRRAICRGLRASRTSSCPAVKAFCDELGGDPPKPDCQKPAPWFDAPSDCKDVQAPAVAINNRAVTVSVCGFPVYRGSPKPPVDELALTTYKDVMIGHVTQTIGTRVCCDKFRESAQSGSPCFPAVDIDCDGVPNQRDTYESSGVVYPDINLFTKAPNAGIDEFPAGLNPDDPNFLPGSTARESKGVGDCPCKWELISGKLACSPDGQKDHVYTATWKCSATGKEVFTTKYAKATAPCRVNRQSGNVNLLFEYFAVHATSDVEWIPAVSGATGCS